MSKTSKTPPDPDDKAREPTLTGSPAMDALAAEFDEMFARMQTPEAQAGMRAAFNASPEELGRAAVAVARQQTG
jgi:hypothetical protein